MKIRAAKKKQNKKVKAAKARAKHAREQRKAAAGNQGDDGDDAMADADAEVNAADEDVAIAEADSERPKLSGRAARALAVQARRQLKQKLGQLKDQRQKIAKKSIARRDERKALGAKIKAAFAVSKNNKGDAEALLQAADNLPDDDDNDDWADDDVEMADQQHLRRAGSPLVRGDEVAGALGRVHRLPGDGEAQRFELRAEHVGDGLHPGKVHRAAILVHQLFEQGDGRLIARLDTLADPAFGGTERGMGERRAAQEQGGAEQRTDHFASSASIAARNAGSSGVVVGAKRAATLPSLAIRNFSKFHSTSGWGLGVRP